MCRFQAYPFLSVPFSSIYVSGKFNPLFLTGFTDAEGCFSLEIIKNIKMKLGYNVRVGFIIGLHEKDRIIL